MTYEELCGKVLVEDIGRARKRDFAGLSAFASLGASSGNLADREVLSRFASVSARSEITLNKCRLHLVKETGDAAIAARRSLLDALTPDVISRLHIPAVMWFALSRLALLDFRFSLALQLRDIAKDRAIHDVAATSDNLHLKLRISLEDGNLPMFSGALAALEGNRPYFLKHRYLYMGEPTPDMRRSPLLDSIIRGKSVAIAGPVDTGLANGAEIDSFDVVVRFNLSDSSIYDKAKFGSRTDVSYYAVEDIGLLAGKDLTEINALKALVVPPGKKGDPVFADVKAPILERIGVDSNETTPFLFGIGAGIQRMLMDIMRYSPGRVKLFNANMFAKKGAVAGYRTVSHNFFVWHEPFSNILFTKRLLGTGRIEADEMMSYALNLPMTEYSEILEGQFREGYLKEKAAIQ